MNREIFTTDRDTPSTDAAKTKDVIGRRVARQCALCVIFRRCGSEAVLLETAVIEHRRDALAQGQPTRSMLLGNAYLSTLLLCQRTPP